MYPLTDFFKIIVAFFILTALFPGKIKAQGNVANTGSGYCLDFTPNLSNSNHVDLGSLAAIDTGNFSIEMWLNVAACEKDPAFFSNKDWSSGNNPGIVLDINGKGNKLRVNLKTSNSSFQNIIVPVNAIGRGWFHLAVTLDRHDFLKVYIDGILQGSLFIHNLLNGSFASPYTYKLGQDGTGAYSDDNGVPIGYDGKIDELRIWKVARTEKQIRENMCKKLSVQDTGLYAYYNCDTTAGNVVRDLTGSHPGKWVKNTPQSWKISGAAIGDTSVVLYPEGGDWNGHSLRLSDTLRGAVKIKNVLAVKGIQLYKINSLPNSLNGLPTYPGNTNYYGIFLSGVTGSTAYDVDFEYKNYAAAVADEPNLKLFTRNKNSDPVWSEYMAQQDMTSHTLFKQGMIRKKELIIGTKAGAACTAPSAITASNQTDTSCTIGWNTGNAANWNTQWGPAGFELGTGTTVLNTPMNPQTIKPLTQGRFYEFYVQDKCSAASESYWVGPYAFYAAGCLSPTHYAAKAVTHKSALLTWKGNGYKSDVEWGLLGFVLGQGIPDSTFTDSLQLKGLLPNTSYAYYVKTNCPTGINLYNGPFTFKTLAKPTGIKENTLLKSISIYPNPARGEFEIALHTTAQKITLQVYDAVGKAVSSTSVWSSNGTVKQTCNLNGLPQGLYFIRIEDGIHVAVKPLVIQ